MATIDFEDELLANGDLAIVSHQRNKIRNIIEHRFADVPRLTFDVSMMIGQPLSSDAVASMLMSHLSDYGVVELSYRLELDTRSGVIDIEFFDTSNIGDVWSE